MANRKSMLLKTLVPWVIRVCSFWEFHSFNIIVFILVISVTNASNYSYFIISYTLVDVKHPLSICKIMYSAI